VLLRLKTAELSTLRAFVRVVEFAQMNVKIFKWFQSIKEHPEFSVKREEKHEHNIDDR
jgi:hypothetical protein